MKRFGQEKMREPDGAKEFRPRGEMISLRRDQGGLETEKIREEIVPERNDRAAAASRQLSRESWQQLMDETRPMSRGWANLLWT